MRQCPNGMSIPKATIGHQPVLGDHLIQFLRYVFAFDSRSYEGHPLYVAFHVDLPVSEVVVRGVVEEGGTL